MYAIRRVADKLLLMAKQEPEYTRLEYIESSGTQYIDTGYYPNLQKTQVEIDFSVLDDSVSTQSLFGCRPTTGFASIDSFNVFYNVDNNKKLRLDIIMIEITGLISIGVSLGGIYKLKSLNNVCYINDAKYIQSGGSKPDSYLTDSFCLFNQKQGGVVSGQGGIMRIYRCILSEGGVVFRDLIPVKDKDGVVCMYDRIGKRFYYNQGTGDFVAGREIHYVDWIKSDGSSYINTRYVLEEEGGVIDLNASLDSFTTASTGILGSRYQGSTYPGTVLFQYATTTTYAGIAIFVGVSGTDIYYYTKSEDVINLKCTYYQKDGGYQTILDINGNSKQRLNTTTYSQAGQPIFLFCFNNAGYPTHCNYAVKIYDCSFYDSLGTLVKVFKPAIDENGVAFMFDEINNRIYDNAGSGEFIYGTQE